MRCKDDLESADGGQDHLSSFCFLAAAVRFPQQRGASSLRGVALAVLPSARPGPGQGRRTHGHPLPPAPLVSGRLACRQGGGPLMQPMQGES